MGGRSGAATSSFSPCSRGTGERAEVPAGKQGTEETPGKGSKQSGVRRLTTGQGHKSGSPRPSTTIAVCSTVTAAGLCPWRMCGPQHIQSAGVGQLGLARKSRRHGAKRFAAGQCDCSCAQSSILPLRPSPSRLKPTSGADPCPVLTLSKRQITVLDGMQATEQLGAGVLVSTLGTIMRVRIYGMDRKTSIVGAVPYLPTM